jgi:outer membrane protein
MKNPTIFLVLAALPLWAQEPLSLQDAVKLALDKHPSIEAAAEQGKAAAERIRQAKAGFLPRVNYSETFQTGNNPVYVFGTLLTQRRFNESNFAIDALNRPDFTNNFQPQIGVEQTIYDFGATRDQVHSAELGYRMTAEQERLARMNLIAQVVRAYHGAVLADESLKVARQAVTSAEADLARAEAVRTAGMSTDADVLSIRVHLAAMREQEISRGYDVQVARAGLNQALGEPLDASHDLTSPLTAMAQVQNDRAELEKQAISERPEARTTELSREMAETQAKLARAALYPRIVGQAAFEADRGQFVKQAGANWFFSAGLRWNLFNGFADQSKIAEAGHAAASARAKEREVTSAVQLQVRQANASLQAATERIAVASAAVSQAEESLRITRNRYEAASK